MAPLVLPHDPGHVTSWPSSERSRKLPLVAQGQIDSGQELMADVLALQGEYGEAVSIYKQLMGKNVSQTLAVKYFTARVEAKREDLLTVLGEAEAWLGENPEMDNLRNFIGVKYVDKDNLAAVKHLEILIEKYPNNIVLLNNLAWAKLDLDPRTALKYSEKAYSMNSDNYSIVDTYVRALKKNNQIDKARELLNDMLKDNPDNQPIKDLLSSLN